MSQDDYFTDGCPAVFHSVGPGEDLKRVDVLTPALPESDLQEILRLHPQLLPISEIEPAFSPCCCLGREVRVSSGRLDNLYVSPTGNLTLVETKLWKNPEARREVVGQLVDYARHMAAWDYTQLETVARDYFTKHGIDGPTLYKWLQNQFGESLLPEERFIDAVNSGLKGGRFLLLIVGDGIRQGVQEMVEYLHLTPQLLFRLALVELQCYRSGDKEWPLTIVPRTLTKTAEITRAIVRVEMTAEAKNRVSVTTTVPSPSETESGTGRSVDLTEDAFYENLLASTNSQITSQVKAFVGKAEAEIPGLSVQIQQHMLLDWTTKAPDMDLDTRLLVIAHKGWLRAPRVKSGRVISPQLNQFWDELGRVHPDLRPQKVADGFTTKQVNIADVADKLDAILVAMSNYAKVCDAQT